MLNAEAPQFIALNVNALCMKSVETGTQLHKLCPGACIAVITDNFQHSVRKNLQGLGILFLPGVGKPIPEGEMQRIFDAM